MKTNQLSFASDYKRVLATLVRKKMLPKYVYHRFLHSLDSQNIEEFLSSGEIIIRSVLVHILKAKKIRLKSNPGWHTLLKTSWKKKIITNESIYSYLWVFAKAVNSIKNGETIVGTEALVHVSVFFAFLEEFKLYFFDYQENPEQKRWHLF